MIAQETEKAQHPILVDRTPFRDVLWIEANRTKGQYSQSLWQKYLAHLLWKKNEYGYAIAQNYGNASSFGVITDAISVLDTLYDCESGLSTARIEGVALLLSNLIERLTPNKSHNFKSGVFSNGFFPQSFATASAEFGSNFRCSIKTIQRRANRLKQIGAIDWTLEYLRPGDPWKSRVYNLCYSNLCFAIEHHEMANSKLVDLQLAWLDYDPDLNILFGEEFEDRKPNSVTLKEDVVKTEIISHGYEKPKTLTEKTVQSATLHLHRLANLLSKPIDWRPITKRDRIADKAVNQRDGNIAPDWLEEELANKEWESKRKKEARERKKIGRLSEEETNRILNREPFEKPVIKSKSDRDRIIVDVTDSNNIQIVSNSISPYQGMSPEERKNAIARKNSLITRQEQREQREDMERNSLSGLLRRTRANITKDTENNMGKLSKADQECFDLMFQTGRFESIDDKYFRIQNLAPGLRSEEDNEWFHLKRDEKIREHARAVRKTKEEQQGKWAVLKQASIKAAKQKRIDDLAKQGIGYDFEKDEYIF